MTARIAAALHAAFGLAPPAAVPPPADPDRFPAILSRPAPSRLAKPTLPTAFHPERLALAGSITAPKR